ncbi:phage tail sheath family protein [Floridanema aerugineum]|uniref:Phage tail sheath family protein n=1 Tax=Floridaenema aerugineum BLCC-F46 TaxID=3153654 RepID=A0ABV4WZG1_9CYAN
MPTVYKTPGVYKEEFFLQPQAILPTGIPAFIGFADAIAALKNLPQGVQLPESLSSSLKGSINYDHDKKLLVFQGVMSTAAREELLALSSDKAFKQAIILLFQNAQNTVVTLHRKQEFTNHFQSRLQSYLTEAITGFFENGGTHCYVVRAAANQNPEVALKNALKAIELLNDSDLVAIPDAMTLTEQDAIIRVQQEVLKHCAKLGDRIAILDAWPSKIGDIKIQRERLAANQQESVNGVFYYPWIKNTENYPQPDNPNRIEKGRFVPPCGHIAGVISRSDRTRGVFKAPANEEIFDALDLEVAIDNSTQGELNPLGINCLRAFPGRGIRIWGARTLSSDENWRYINVRRIFLTLARWIDRNMFWVTFEPNTEQLWVRIERELSSYLEQLWRAGALLGQTRKQAFYVKCDAETNSPESREKGEVLTEIGLAPSSPAEFIIVRIIQRSGIVESG